MRALAHRLDTGPAALYVYVRNREEIVTELFDGVFAEIPTPNTQGSSWQEEILVFAVSAVEHLARWPGLAASQLGRIPVGAAVFDAIEAILSCLAHGGVEIRRAALAADGLILMIVAHAAELATLLREPQSLTVQLETAQAAMRELPADRYPVIRSHIDELLDPTPEQRVHWSLRAFINGIAETPIPNPKEH